MGVFSRYPYSNAHQLNLDWILSELDKMKEEMEDIKDISTITYADPIRWKITTQYATNTVVLDTNGNAYLSKQPVPSGILLTNSDYWQQIGNFGAEVSEVRTLINAETDNRIEADDAIGARITALDTKIDEMDPGLVNVKDYGAVGDGVADDTAALQSALDEANGRTIFIPTGVYKTTRTLVYPSFTYIMGAGMMNTVIKPAGENDAFVSEGFYSSTGTDTVNNVCHTIIFDNFTIDGGFYSDINTYTKSGKNLGRGLCFYGTDFQIKNMRIINCPQSNLWLEFSDNWSKVEDRATMAEGLLLNNIIALSGENGIFIRKVYDFKISNCSIHTNGQKNSGSSAKWSHIHLVKGCFKMSNSHLSSLYGPTKPNVAINIESEAGSCNITNSHIEGAYYPMVIRAPYQFISNCYIYGSFGYTDVYLATNNCYFDNCMFGPQVADETHTYPTWTGAFTFVNNSAYNYIHGVLSATRFTNNLGECGFNNTFILRGAVPSDVAFMEDLSRPAVDKAEEWDVILNSGLDPKVFRISKNLRNFNTVNLSYGAEALTMKDDVFTHGKGLIIVNTYTAGTIYINAIGNPGDEITIMNNTDTDIPINGTGGIYVNGITYPAANSAVAAARKATKLMAIDSTRLVTE